MPSKTSWTSWTDDILTTDSLECVMKEPTWQASSSQEGGLRVAKSDESIAESETCLIDACYRLTTDRKVDTQGLMENSPWYNFSYA